MLKWMKLDWVEKHPGYRWFVIVGSIAAFCSVVLAGWSLVSSFGRNPFEISIIARFKTQRAPRVPTTLNYHYIIDAGERQRLAKRDVLLVVQSYTTSGVLKKRVVASTHKAILEIRSIDELTAECAVVSLAIATPTISVGDHVQRLDRLDVDEFHRLSDINRTVAAKSFSSEALNGDANYPNVDDAIAAYKHFIETRPESRWRSDALMTVAHLLYERGRYEEAAPMYAEVITKYHERPEAAGARGRLNEIHARQEIRREPSLGNYLRLADIQTSNGDHVSAFATLGGLLQRNPEHTGIRRRFELTRAALRDVALASASELLSDGEPLAARELLQEARIVLSSHDHEYRDLLARIERALQSRR